MRYFRPRYVFVTIAVVGVATLVGLLTQQNDAERPPLSGELTHDFGEVFYEGVMVELEHVFTLVNTSDRTVKIGKIAPTCGCTVGEVSREVIQPGQTTAVTITLTLSQPGRRSEKVWLALEGIGSLALSVSGAARRVHDFYAMQSSVALSPTDPQQIILVATDHETDLRPPEVSVVAPEGILVTTSPWEFVMAHDDRTARPARWQSIINVSTDLQLPPDAFLTISIDEKRELRINLSGRPWA